MVVVACVVSMHALQLLLSCALHGQHKRQGFCGQFFSGVVQSEILIDLQKLRDIDRKPTVLVKMYLYSDHETTNRPLFLCLRNISPSEQTKVCSFCTTNYDLSCSPRPWLESRGAICVMNHLCFLQTISNTLRSFFLQKVKPSKRAKALFQSNPILSCFSQA